MTEGDGWGKVATDHFVDPPYLLFGKLFNKYNPDLGRK